MSAFEILPKHRGTDLFNHLNVRICIINCYQMISTGLIFRRFNEGSFPCSALNFISRNINPSTVISDSRTIEAAPEDLGVLDIEGTGEGLGRMVVAAAHHDRFLDSLWEGPHLINRLDGRHLRMLGSAESNLDRMGLGELRGCSLVGTPNGSVEGTRRYKHLRRAGHRPSRTDPATALQGVLHSLVCPREHLGEHLLPADLLTRHHSLPLEGLHGTQDINVIAVAAVDLEVVGPPCILHGELDRSVD
jgi:hypothetical protein